MALTDEIKQRTATLFGQGAYTTDAAQGGIPLALRVGVLVNTVLLLIGIVFLMITVYSGIHWMLAAGNEEKIVKARTRIIRATIGLAIVVGSWVMVSFVLRAIFGGLAPPDTGFIRGQIFR